MLDVRTKSKNGDSDQAMLWMKRIAPEERKNNAPMTAAEIFLRVLMCISATNSTEFIP